jgi:UDP-glucose 4-epimerase
MRVTGTTVLVTGGAGFIGSHLVEEIIARGARRVIVVDTLWLGRESNLTGARQQADVILEKEDAADHFAMRNLLARERVDIVFNLATRPLSYSFLQPRGAFATSVEIAVAFAELLREGRYGCLVNFSTSEVYGEAQTVPMTEDHPLTPTTPYAAGKLAADALLQSYVALFQLPVLTIRPFNNYGPRQNDGDHAAVIPVTIRRIASGLPPILEGPGEQTRDFIFVRDTARLAVDLCEATHTWGRTYNLAGGAEVRIRELIDIIARLMDYTGPIEQRPARPGDHRRHLGSSALARAVVPFGELTSIQAGIGETVQWYLRGHTDALNKAQP